MSQNDVSKRDRKKTAYRDAKTFTEEQLEGKKYGQKNFSIW